MKNITLIFFVTILLLSCSGESARNRNPYLPDYNFSIAINTNLPLYNGLNSPINPIIVNDGVSNISVIVMKVSNTDYRAWDINCPNKYPTACSRLSINGVNAKCGCDEVEYSLFTGIGAGNYTLKPYRVEVSGTNFLRVYN